jgi:hypothetical protein
LTLDELEIDIRIIPELFNAHMINRTVKKLTLRLTIEQDDLHFRNHLFHIDNLLPITNSNIGEKVISICQAVEEIMILEYSFRTSLKALNRNLRNLKVLRLDTLPKTVPKPIEFDKLEVIEIDKLNSQQDINNCTSLVLQSRHLKTLKINFIERNIFKSNFFVKIVTKSKNLREIHLGVRCLFTLDMIDAVRQAKDRGYPLQTISFLFCLMDDSGSNRNSAVLDGLKLNFHQSAKKLFSAMTNDTKVGRMSREIDEKKANLEHQKWCSDQRQIELEIYKRTTNLAKGLDAFTMELLS